MAAVNPRSSTETLVPASVFLMQGHLDDARSQLQDASNKTDALNQMEGEAQRIEANLEKIECGIRELEGFVDAVEHSDKLTQAQLELLVGLMDDEGLPVDQAVAASAGMVELADLLDKLAGLVEEADRPAFQGLQPRLREYASRWRTGRQRILQLAQRWKYGMISLRLLSGMARRRPLTTREKILMLHASVIDTPVVQDPSDSREDWYDDDGR